jgi:hypothetical protein
MLGIVNFRRRQALLRCGGAGPAQSGSNREPYGLGVNGLGIAMLGALDEQNHRWRGGENYRWRKVGRGHGYYRDGVWISIR